MALFDSTRRARVASNIAVTKRDFAKGLLAKHVPWRGLTILAEIETGRRNDETMPPPIEDGYIFRTSDNAAT